jgi:hypothetical protein
MLKTQNLARRLSTAAVSCGFIGIPLWLLSYVWIPFRLAGRESEAMWSFAVACEIGAMLAGLLGIVLGVVSRRRFEPGGADSRNATRAIMLGAGVWICLVVFNLAGIIFFS